MRKNFGAKPWTYPLPVIPLLVLIDGVISRLKAYTREELNALCKEIPGAAADSYTYCGWHINSLEYIPRGGKAERITETPS